MAGALASQGSLQAGSTPSDAYVIPMDIGVGFSFHPDLGTFAYFLDPRLSMDFRNIVGTLQGSALFWTAIRPGAEIRLFKPLFFGGGSTKAISQRVAV